MSKIMNPKIKTLVVALIVGIVLVGVFWIWNSTKQIQISGILEHNPYKAESFSIDGNIIIPNPEVGIDYDTLMSYSGKEIRIEGVWKSIIVGSSAPGCERLQIGCERKIKMILPKKIILLEDKTCEKDRDCIFTQCCGCAKECNKECDVKQEPAQCLCFNNKCVSMTTLHENVTITTDKKEYELEEPINITIVNNGNRPIFYFEISGPPFICEGSLSIEIKQNESFKELFLATAYCRTDETKLEAFSDKSYSIKITKELVEEWEENYLKEKIKFPATFRFKFRYFLKRGETPETVIYSNEFTIGPSECERWKQKIEEKIANSKYCNADSDCINVFIPSCTFGCNKIIVNKNEADYLKREVGRFVEECNDRCLLKCLKLTPRCINNKCQP